MLEVLLRKNKKNRCNCLENWEILELIEISKGGREFDNLSQYGMEREMEKYQNGTFSTIFHNFYRRNKNYFNVYSNDSEELRSLFEDYNKQYYEAKNENDVNTRFESWEVIELIKKEKGVDKFKNLSQYEIEMEMEKYKMGIFTEKFYDFYTDYINYFNEYSNDSEELKNLTTQYKKKYGLN